MGEGINGLRYWEENIWFLGYRLLSWAVFPFLVLTALLHVSVKPSSVKMYLGKFAIRLPKRHPGTARVAWLHAVSVGEVLSCEPLVKRFQERGVSVCLSTGTSGGWEVASRLYPDATVFYAPFDYVLFLRRIIERIRPHVLLLCEVEIWPALVREVKRAGISLYLVSGRLGDKDFQRYLLIKPFLRQVLALFNGLFMQSELDSSRMMALCPEGQIRTVGSLKWDMSTFPPYSKGLEFLSEGLTICAASTHKGDEEVIIRAFRSLQSDFPQVRLVIAPRHLRRVKPIRSLLDRHGIGYTLRSEKTVGKSPVFIIDTFGELSEVFARSQVVIMGGSFSRKVGGHNLVEPALFGNCILCGEHMENFRSVFEVFKSEDALVITDRERLGEHLGRLLKDGSERLRVGERARQVVERNKGATERILNAITRPHED